MKFGDKREHASLYSDEIIKNMISCEYRCTNIEKKL